MSAAAAKTAPYSSASPDNNITGREAATFSALSGNNISAHTAKVLAFTITQREYTERVQKCMRDHAGMNDAAKKLARDLGCSIGTAKNYLEGRTTPAGILDIRAMAVIPGFLALKTELAGLEMEMDPRHQKKMTDFMRFCAAQAQQIFGKE